VTSFSATSLSGLPEVEPGDDLASMIFERAAAQQPSHLLDGTQIVVIAHKAVSKAEGAVVTLANIEPSRQALELAREQDKDPRAVQVVLDQSREIMRAANGVLITRTHHGFVCANAGVDASNAVHADELIVLPRDPDASARELRARLRELTGTAPGVLITDSFGRAWRHGQCDVAIGCAGVAALDDWRGRTDSSGRTLRATWLAVGDAVCAMADLARAKDSREPVVIVEGLEHLITPEDGPGAAVLLRPEAEDMFL
jgi:coenzyme F420-0:L-glutamate ligase / coenzyme F420-1:gamma-L-glutamate ligase